MIARAQALVSDPKQKLHIWLLATPRVCFSLSLRRFRDSFMGDTGRPLANDLHPNGSPW